MKRSNPIREPEVVATYKYRDADGEILYTKKRFEPALDGVGKKSFAFYHTEDDKDVNGRGSDAVLYNLQKVTKNTDVFIVEGEDKVRLLKKWGLTATCLDAGANSPWLEEYSEILKGKEIVILPDNDDPGRKYASKIANKLYGKVKELKVVELPGLPDKGDIIDWAKIEGNNTDKLADIILADPEWTPENDKYLDGNAKEEVWEEPLLFGQLETPEMPADILPSWLGGFAGAVSKQTQTPPAMAVMFALSVVATCLQRRFEVSYSADYKEPLSLWTLTALPSGSRKTSVITLITKPLSCWEDEQRERMSREVAENETNRDVISKRIDKLKLDAAKTEDRQKRIELMREIDELKEEMPEEIKYPRLWTGDITPEQLQNLMAAHGERMALLSDEGGIFEIMSGLYSNGKANLDIFLKSHSGSPVRVDRGSRPPVIMQEPALTFGLAIQPDVVTDLSQGRKKGFRGNGTLARFLYAMPISNIGKRDVTQRNPIPESIKVSYSAGISSLLSIAPVKDQNDNDIPRTLTLSKEALEIQQRLMKFVESELADGGSLESIRDWGSKLPGAALRIAGLMHVVEYGEKSTVIGNKTMERALDLCKLLIAHAKAAFDLMEDNKATVDAKYILKWMLQNEKEMFTQNECQKSSTGRF